MDKRFDTYVQHLKYRVLLEVATDYWEGTLDQKKRKIPKIISPGPKSTMRCCIYKEREIVRERIELALGGDPENPNLLEVIEAACDSCPFSGVEVTDLCRGCIAHRCEQACHRNAISFGPDLHARIDKNLCVNCGLCAAACPFGAIANRRRPCEVSCKVNAIHAREDGISEIDEEKCTRCGQCSYACPFGAIMDKSFITRCIDFLKEKEADPSRNVYLVAAPSISSQFDFAKLGQVITGCKKLGFTHVVEAAVGADLVAMNEAKELSSKGFLTSSCCPAFVRYVKISYPTLKDKISSNYSPMAAIGRYIKSTDPNAKVVFVGPCIAKKMEAMEKEVAPYIDCVITFEELMVLFDAKKIDLTTLEESPLDNASYFGRIFARSGGVSEAVAQALKEQGSTFEVKPVKAAGLDQCKMALNQARSNRLQGNFIEGMACPGGCIGGPAALTHATRDAAEVDMYAKSSKEKTLQSAVDYLMADPSIAGKEE